MSQEQKDDHKNEKENGKVAIPRSLDPGWATVLAAGLALIGTLGAVILGRSAIGSPSPTATLEPTSAVSQAKASDTPAPAATEALPTLPPATPTLIPPTPTPEATPTASSTVTVEPKPVATISLLENLSPAEVESVEFVWRAARDLASKLPLIIRDSFDVNDYDWPEWEEIGTKGVACEVAVRDSGFSSSVQTTTNSGPGHCLSYAPRGVGANFILTFDATLTHNRNAKILYYYRYIDDSNFCYLLLNPQTQLLTVGIVEDGINTPFFERYTPKINKTGANKITTLMLGNAQTILINDDAIGTITYLSDIVSGNVMLGLELHEADETEELVIDNFEIRGDL